MGLVSREISKNTIWILVQKLVTLGGGFVVASATARHLGPDDFGNIAYALSLFSLLAVTGHLGLGNLAIRELVRDARGSGSILGTIALTKFCGLVIGASVLLAIAALTYEENQKLALVLLPFAIALLFRISDIFDFWYQSLTRAKIITICYVVAFVIAAAFSFFGIGYGKGVLWFSFYTLVLNISVFCLFIYSYHSFSNGPAMNTWRFDFSRLKSIARPAALVGLGTFFSLLSLKADQLMLHWMIGSEEVAIYAVAAQLSEVWIFVPTALIISVFPALISLRSSDPKRYSHELQKIFCALCVMAYVLVGIICIVAKDVVLLFFGHAYYESILILQIHVLGSIFLFMRLAFSRWILIEDALVFSLTTQFLGALVNIVLNYIFIPAYGAEGAALVTVFSYSISSYWALLFSNKTRPIFLQMTTAFFNPYKGAKVLYSWFEITLQKAKK